MEQHAARRLRAGMALETFVVDQPNFKVFVSPQRCLDGFMQPPHQTVSACALDTVSMSLIPGSCLSSAHPPSRKPPCRSSFTSQPAAGGPATNGHAATEAHRGLGALYPPFPGLWASVNYQQLHITKPYPSLPRDTAASGRPEENQNPRCARA